MGETVTLSAKKYFVEAKKMLEKKDLLGFVSKISIAIEVSRNDQSMLAESTYLCAEGLFTFSQHKKALESIEEALQYNTGYQAFLLKKRKGTVLGYLGNLDEAIKIFKELIAEIDDTSELVRLYIYITWVHLSLDKNQPTKERLDEVRYYLDLAHMHFDTLSNELKWKTCNAFSVYYYFSAEYHQAVECLKEALTYCEEKDLPYIYGNLAETYLKFTDEDVSHLIREFTEKAEVIGGKFNDNIAVARAFYTKAMSELNTDQLFTALDTLYLAFEYYKQAEAYPLAFECLVKINEIMSNYKIDRLRALQDSIKADFNGTPYYSKI